MLQAPATEIPHRWACLVLVLCWTLACARGPDPAPPDDPSVFPPTPQGAVAAADSYYAVCGGLVRPMVEILAPAADALVAQEIPYSNDGPQWRDCSGTFLRLSSRIAGVCPDVGGDLPAPAGVPDYAPGGDNVVGTRPGARSTRDLARWYHDRGRFVPIWGADPPGDPGTDLDAVGRLLKPGAVVWFAAAPPVASRGLDALFAPTDDGSPISHMGLVVRVDRDDAGGAVGYAMFHGRSGGKVAAITGDHRRSGGRRSPPFGNGGQHLVGIGVLLPPRDPP